VKIPLILRKICENMAAESGSIPLKVGELTFMELPSRNEVPSIYVK
jgi:hypothetical protein